MHVPENFLNLILHYAPAYVINNEILDEMYECLNMMVSELEKYSKIDYQFERKRWKFWFYLTILALKTKTPTQ